MARTLRGILDLKRGGNISTKLHCDQVYNLHLLTYITNIII
jgi:hypothetical protein